MKSGHYLVFSFDDGIQDDVPLVALLNQFHFKTTFFLNGLFDEQSPDFQDEGATVVHLPHKILKSLYTGHEVAVHTWSHPNLKDLSDQEIKDELNRSRDWIESTFGLRPVGLAYPFGIYDQRVVNIARQLGFRYGRTIDQAQDFSLSQDALTHHPSAHFLSSDFKSIVQSFLKTPSDEIQVLHFWGHSYELTGHHQWDEFYLRLDYLSRQKELINVTLKELFNS
jgi:peptidoglycan/xylan/chitin deacetylase (PgdA/CDA1 family)